MFHVDDFTTLGTGQGNIDAFGKHLKGKYEITTNTDGTFLGIRCTRRADGSMIYTKPYQLESIFDKWLLEGHAGPPPREPMSAEYLQKIRDESPPVAKSNFMSLMGALMQLIDVRPDLASRCRSWRSGLNNHGSMTWTRFVVLLSSCIGP